ncbi:MAG: TIGR03435 family protein, partial [Terriglobus sp.]
MRRFARLMWLGMCCVPAVAQAPRKPAFEVVSIHVHPAGQNGRLGFYGSAGGRVELDSLTLSWMVAIALDVDHQRVTGAPNWANDVHYDVTAIPPEDSPSRAITLTGHISTPTVEQRAMILAMLVDRFGLKYHEEMVEIPVYVLKRGNGPLKLDAPKHPERAADPRGGLVMMNGGLATGQGFGENLTMDLLAKQLEWPLERPVVNETGVKGV